ncbi:MAG: PAS domain S-box protein, partial [Pseudomonadota bacterium]
MSNQPPPMRILYLDDNQADVNLTRRALASTSSLEVAPDLATALALLASPSPPYEVALSDLRLPDGSGLDLLAHVRTRKLPLAVVILTASGDQDSAVAALKAGADDYLIKHGDYLKRLPETLARAQAHFRETGAGRTRALRVLYAEDNPLDVELTRHHLLHYAPHLQLEVLSSGAELLNRLPDTSAADPPCEILLLDFKLPDTNALELIKIIREERELDLPVVVVSGQGNEEVVADAMRLGVEDYLVKHGGYLFELPATLERAHRQAQLRREHEALRASEKQLRRLEERFRTIYDSAIDGILVADIATLVFITGNPAICRMLGYRQEELAQLRVQDIHPEADLPWIADCFARQTTGQDRFTPDIPLRRKDGSVVYADLNTSPVELDGKPCLMGIFRDSTERRRAEERMRLDAVALAASRDAVVITDLSPAILGVNPAFSEITGYQEAEVLGKNPKILASGHHDRAFYQAMWASLLEDGAWRGEIWNRRKNGEAYPELLSISTVRDKMGKPSHYVAVATDLTLIRQSEERVRHLVHYDPLTGLPNRLLLEARLQHSLERADRGGIGVAVLVI